MRYESEDLLVHLELIEKGRAAGLLPALLLARGAQGLERTPTGSARMLLTLTRAGSEHSPTIRAVRDSLLTALRSVDPARMMPSRPH